MAIPIVALWGVTVPGRPPTPSEGRAQVYNRVGPFHQQAIRSFDNGTSLQFGPLDLIDEFKEGHPFFEQVLHIDNALNNITIVRGRHDGEGGSNNRAFERFRGEHLAEDQLARVKIDEFFYLQAPSKFAQITTTLSVYSHTLGQPKKGASHPAEVDTRYGVQPRPDPVQLAASHGRGARQRSQQQYRNVRDNSLRVQVVRRNNLHNNGGSMHRQPHMHGNRGHNDTSNRARGNRGRGSRVPKGNRGDQGGNSMRTENERIVSLADNPPGKPAQHFNRSVSGRFHTVNQSRRQKTQMHNLTVGGGSITRAPAANPYTGHLARPQVTFENHDSYQQYLKNPGFGQFQIDVEGQGEQISTRVHFPRDIATTQPDRYSYGIQTLASGEDHLQFREQKYSTRVQGEGCFQREPTHEFKSLTHFPIASDPRPFLDYILHPSTRGSPELRYSGNGFPPGPAPTVSHAEIEAASYLANVNERLENMKESRQRARPASAGTCQPTKFETCELIGHFFSQGVTRVPSPAKGATNTSKGIFPAN